MPRALVLDDEQPFERLFTLFMAMLEWNCEVVNNPGDALALLKKSAFDVIITDYHLLQTNGLHFLCLVRAQGIETPAIVMSGDLKALRNIPKDLLNVRAIIRKPFSGSDLDAALKLALAR
jgi:DNA-binding response OmpR family regulator